MTIHYIVQGDMDALGMQMRQADWTRLAVSNRNVQLDLEHVKNMDSSGLGAVLFLYKRLTAARKRFEIINAQGQPLDFIRKFDALGLLSAQTIQAKRRVNMRSRASLRRAANLERRSA